MARFTRWLGHLRSAWAVLIAAPLGLRAVSLVRTLPVASGACNPSVAVFEGRLLAAVRVAGYRIEDGQYRFTSDDPFASRTMLLELTPDLEVVGSREVDTAAVRRQLPEAADGLEDPRLYVSSGRLMCLWSGLEMGSGRPPAPKIGDLWRPEWAEARNTMVTAELVDAVAVNATAMQSPRGEQREKNWMPLSLTAPQVFCYRLASGEFYEWSQGIPVAAVERVGAPQYASWSGSSQFIRWGEGWIGVIHRAVRGNPLLRWRWPASYIHKFVVIDDSFNVTAESRAFCFFTRGIEFCAGIAQVGSDLIISFGIDDASAAALRLSGQNVERMLKKR